MMITDKIKAKYNQTVEALSRLEEAINTPDSALKLDACIQRFEFSYELLWKILKIALEKKGVLATTPKDVFRGAFQAEIIDGSALWGTVVETRNLTVHTYNERLASEVFETLPDYLILFKACLQKINIILND